MQSSFLLLFTKCSKSISDEGDCRVLQENLNNLSMWSRSWHLSFNETKYVAVRYLLCSLFPSFKHTYFNNDHPVVTKESYRDLSILMSEDLSWKLSIR